MIRTVAVLILLAVAIPPPGVHGQDLVPGAYTPGPIRFNVVTALAGFNRGDVTFDPSLPVEEGRATIRVAALGIARTLGIGGHYANVGLVVPYAYGHVRGLIAGQFEERTRSGMADISARFAMNLYGAPALRLKEFAAYRPSTIVGISFALSMPTGQYDPDKIINIGTNRWAFKPELGVTRRRGHWTVEGDLGAVFFTDNTNFRNGGRREQAPIVTVQGHLIYTFRPGLWIAVDGNFWRGGRVTTNGAPAARLQSNSRLGTTLAIPVRRHQFRVAYSAGAYTRLGGDYHSIGLSYSYAWTRQ